MYEGLFTCVKNFPEYGSAIMDVSSYFADANAFNYAIDELHGSLSHSDIVVGVEAYGFVLGTAFAMKRGMGIVCLRKDRKLALADLIVEYSMKYRPKNIMCANSMLLKGRDCVIIDDVIDTTGTISAAIELVEKSGARVVGIGSLIAEKSDNLAQLSKDYPFYSVYYFQDILSKVRKQK